MFSFKVYHQIHKCHQKKIIVPYLHLRCRSETAKSLIQFIAKKSCRKLC